MKNNIKPQQIESLKKYFQIIASAESNGDYRAINQTEGENGKTPTYALGKYQFVPKWWWNEIVSFVKNNKELFPDLELKPFDNNKDISIYNEFLNNELLQEAFMEYYVEKKVVPAVEKAKANQEKYGKTELSLDEMAFAFHYLGEGDLTKYLRSGKDFTPGDQKQNISVSTHLENYRKYRDESGSAKIPVNLKSEKEVFQEWKSKKDKILNNKDLSEDLKKLALKDLDYQYYKEGYLTYNKETGQTEGILVDGINSYNAEQKQKFENDRSNLQRVFNLFSNDKVIYHKDKKRHPNDKRIIYTEDPRVKDEFLKLAKEFPELWKLTEYYGNTTSMMIQNFEKDHKNNGRRLNLGSTARGAGFVDKNTIEDVLVDITQSVYGTDSKVHDYIGRVEGGYSTLFEDIGNWFKSIDEKKGSTINFSLANYERQNNVKFDNNRLEHAPVFYPEWETKIKEEAERNAQENAQENTQENTQAEGETDVDLNDPEVEVREESTSDTRPNDLENFLNEMEYMTPEAPMSYTKKPSLEFGLSAASSLFGALYGLNEADQDLPVYDQEISEGLIRYVQELDKLSKIGLRPEEEAYAKNMLSESYNTSIENLVRASAGNRNIVLGNMGRIDSQKNEQLLNLALADAEAKRNAFAQYGEAMKYINEFEANKAIAQNERDYQKALMDKQAGGELAAAAFQNLLNEIDYQKTHGPGSLSDMYKSFFMQKYLGVNPNIPDDGEGTTPYTESYNRKMYEEAVKRKKDFERVKQDYFTATDEEKAKMESIYSDSGKNFDYFLSNLNKPTKTARPTEEINNFEYINAEQTRNQNPNLPEDKFRSLIDSFEEDFFNISDGEFANV